MSDVPQPYRVISQASDLEAAVAFYTRLLGVEGRSIRASPREFDCGPVILAVLDPTVGGENARSIYFSVKDLEAVHARAKALRCLSQELVHEAPAGEIVRRPPAALGDERSLPVVDSFGNGSCVVDATTLFTGR